MTFVNVI